MNIKFSTLMNETVGAAVGTSLGVCAVRYAIFTLVTNSLEILF
jgi:hypothetical protein